MQQCILLERNWLAVQFFSVRSLVLNYQNYVSFLKAIQAGDQPWRGFSGHRNLHILPDWISQSAEILVLKLPSVALERGNQEVHVGSFL